MFSQPWSTQLRHTPSQKWPSLPKVALHRALCPQLKLTLERVFRERKVHIVPRIVHLSFLYPKLSQIFFWQYSLKIFKIRYCKSCCHHLSTTVDDLNLSVEFSKSQTGVFVCKRFIIGESVDSELSVVT